MLLLIKDHSLIRKTSRYASLWSMLMVEIYKEKLIKDLKKVKEKAFKKILFGKLLFSYFNA